MVARGVFDKYRGWRRSKSLPDKKKDNKVLQVLKENIDFLQKLIDTIPNPIFYKDCKGIYQGCNRAFESYIGKEKSQVIGKNVHELSSYELSSTYYKMDEELFLHPGVQNYESCVQYSDGTQHDVIFDKATYTNTNNEIAGLVGVITDITERKKMESELKRSTEKLNNILEQIVRAMATVTETRDMYTAGHQRRVSELAVAIAHEMQMSDEVIKSVQVAGMLHDIGKIAVPAELLTKPNALSIHEFGIIREHAEAGYLILSSIEFPWPIAEIVYQHHERVNGTGYPKGLKGEEMLLPAKIIAVADVVEAMSSHRPYRASRGIAQAILEINSNRGSLYDEEVVLACIKVFERKAPFTV